MVSSKRRSLSPATNAARSASMASQRVRAAASVVRSRPCGTAGFAFPSQRLSHSCSAHTMWHSVPWSPPWLLLRSRKYASPGSGSSAAKHRRLAQALRSEEHTSELQSRFELVCRLLLEKKKRNQLLG